MRTTGPYLMAAIFVSALAFHPTVKAADRGGSLTQADKASRAFDDAQFRGDVPALERFLAPEFLYVRGSGRVADRHTFIANFTDPGQHLDPFVITDRRIIPLGRDAIVVAADGIISGSAAGRPFREHFRYADTFVRRGGRWVVVYVQVTPVAP